MVECVGAIKESQLGFSARTSVQQGDARRACGV